MDDVQAVLSKADSQLVAAGTLYVADLELQRVSPTLRGKIKAFLDNEQAALDQLAQRLAAGGAAPEEARYPLADDAEGFDSAFDQQLPGVREGRPEVAAALARHQPFDVPALGRLRDLVADPKRQRLSPDTRPAPKVEAAEETATQAEPAEPAPAPPHLPPGPFGAGLTGPLVINGAEYDPVTLKPLNPAPEQVRDSIYVAWRFEGIDEPALQTLEAIQAAVAAAVAEISAAASL